MFRNPSIDAVRGILVLMVMMGHMFESRGGYEFMVWCGFGFRMPLFIGLSGYMFNLDQARSGTLGDLERKYRKRLTIPWLFAGFLYVVAAGDPVSVMTPVEMLLRPSYHLWFVPVLATFFVLAKLLPFDRSRMVLLAVPVSVAAMFAFGVGHGIEQYGPLVPDRRYFAFPLYFALGMLVAKVELPTRWRVWAVILCVSGMIWWIYLFDHPHRQAEVVAKLMLNVPLIALLPWILSAPLGRSPLSIIGRDSLFFYLWHPMLFAVLIAMEIDGALMFLITVALLFAGRSLLAPMGALCTVTGVIPRRGNRPPLAEQPLTT